MLERPWLASLLLLVVFVGFGQAMTTSSSVFASNGPAVDP